MARKGTNKPREIAAEISPLTHSNGGEHYLVTMPNTLHESRDSF